MSNDMTALRGILFDTLRDLRTNHAADVERARAVRDLAGVLVDTARVEVDMMRVTGRSNGTGFLQIEQAVGDKAEKLTAPNGSTSTVELLAPGVRRTVHKTGGG